MTLLDTAKKYRDAGLNIVPCRNKIPMLETWTEYQHRVLTDEELTRLFSQKNATQIAVICGAISGSLEVIDVDTKQDHEGTLWDNLWNDLIEYFGGKHVPLVVIQTQSGGVHLYYRAPNIGRNQKLATLIEGGQAVIETRAEGGYVIAPPSPGYKFLNGTQTMESIPELTALQRDDIIDICRKYNRVFKEVKKKTSSVQASAYRHTPWDAYNNDEDEPWSVVMQDAGWEQAHTDRQGRIHWKRPGSDNKYGANWDPAKRLLYVFTPNGGFENEKAYSPTAIYAFLKCGGDFSLAVKEIRAAGYGEAYTEKDERFIAKAGILTEKGLAIEDIINMLSFEWTEESADLKDLGKEEREQKVKEDLTPLVEAASTRIAQQKGLFWKTDKKGNVSIAEDLLVYFLRDQGFKLFVQDAESLLYRIVKIDMEHRLIYEVTDDIIMKWMEEWIKENAEDYEVSRPKLILALFNFVKWSHYLKLMPRLSFAEVSFLRDTKTISYLPFRNGVVKIDQDDCVIIQYHELPEGMLVWRNQIRPTDIEIMGIEDGNDLAFNESPVFRFLKRIAGIMPDQENIALNDLARQEPKLYSRFMSFLTTIGYLCSNYKDPGRPYAVILAEDTASDKKGGGAGKDLLMKCVKQIRGVSFLPGKQWSAKKDFAFQTYKMGDDILYIGDPPKYFPFDELYNMITEGLTIEKKNKDAFVIPYELSPKVALSTNYMVDDSSEHAARRQIKLLLTKYYSKNLRVEDELGGQFWGENWKHRDWMLFYLVMFTCIQLYLSSGVVGTETTDNAKEKSVRQQYGDEFFEFMASWLPENRAHWVNYKELYHGFLEEASLTDKTFKQNRFAYGLEYLANTYGLTLTTKRRKDDHTGKYQKFIIFTKQGEQIPENVPIPF